MHPVIFVEFKANRKDYFYNKDALPLQKNDYVLVEAEMGVDFGRIRLTSEEVDLQAIEGRELRSVIRAAIPSDLEALAENRRAEERAKGIIKEKIIKFGLKMKLVDAEYQFDRKKLVFFFTADKRVDFRALVRDLAAEFKTRIELRQIGVRDEAKRVDGYGPCGRRLCCSSFLTEFKPITTESARDQGLQLNPSKLTGMCGRLKCCLAYERDYYVSTLSRLPRQGSPITTDKGEGEILHLDIIRNLVQIRHSDGEIETLALEEVSELLKIDLNSPTQV